MCSNNITHTFITLKAFLLHIRSRILTCRNTAYVLKGIDGGLEVKTLEGTAKHKPEVVVGDREAIAIHKGGDSTTTEVESKPSARFFKEGCFPQEKKSSNPK